MNRRRFASCRGRIGLLTLAVLALAPAVANAATRLVTYHGYSLRVPASWPVYHLARDPATCVRFNRHAVYLGRPGANEVCPAHAFGRTEAVLISPTGGAAALPSASALLDTVRLTVPAHRLTVTATWGNAPAIIRRALDDRAIGAVARTDRATLRAQLARAHAHASVTGGGPVASAASTVFTGSGFDACDDPSLSQLTAWLASPYRAVGTYIGGTNLGCSQPNLNATYVTDAVAAGWHLIPTYVGLQAPSNSCGCAPITPSEAAFDGTADAQDAVNDAAAVGIGPGNPIYDDMEAYPPGATNTPVVMTFLSAWTTELHTLGYQSGVYSSTDSGIRDLVAAASTPGNPYALPDDLWNADWNSQATTADAAIPSTEWANHQRLHQNQGAHNETYAGVKINIDGDYVDGATVGSGNVTAPPTTPVLSVAPQADGSIELNGTWNGTSGITGWQLLGGSTATALAPLTGALPSGAVTSHSAFSYFSEEALGASGQVLGTTPVTATPAHLAIYGHSLFAPAHGWVGLPVGCFTGTTCFVATTVTAGRTLVASSKPERVAAGNSGIVYVTLTAAGRRLLDSAHGRRLAVSVTAVDGSTAKASVPMTMIPFLTSGRGPRRSGDPGSTVKVVGYTDFVAGSGFGGVLTGCFGANPCRITTEITSGRTLLATTGAEFIGANELGYLVFRMTAAGRALLARTTGNQLAAALKLSNGEYGTATANIALVRFR